MRNKTRNSTTRSKTHLQEIDDEIADLNKQAEELPFSDITGKDTIYQQVDELKKDRDKKIEEILKEILPEAFAVVKETARRFKENTETRSYGYRTRPRPERYKKNISASKAIKSIYKNSWTAGGNLITWNMVHYDVQLIGGMVLHQGKISEMATGEGKTLVSTLPAYLNALAGQGVHIVTVNDYLARRDSEWNGTIYEWLDLLLIASTNISPTATNEEKHTRLISPMAPTMNLASITCAITWCTPPKKWCNANTIMPWWMRWIAY